MTEKLVLILARKPDDKWGMWACRGTGQGCARNRHRSRATPCPDCFGPLKDDMTLAEVQERLAGGTA